MKKYFLFLSLFSSLVFINSCQKELSFETGGTPSEGTLQSDLGGDCLPKTVGGIYEAGTALVGTTNYIDVEVDVITAGSYVISSDTINGIHFNATGVFTATGLNTVRLKGAGTPVASGITNYLISYDGTECSVAITTLPAGGASPASFTLDPGAAGACLDYILSGTYTVGAPLNSPGNTVVIKVTVATIGTYNITTAPAVNGMVFAGTGAFLTTGANTITLTASGVPAASGNHDIPVTAGASTCKFTVPVVGPATYTINCTTADVQGTYTENVPLDASNVVDVEVNVTGLGGYTITGTAQGMTFKKTGVFTVLGVQTVTLDGTGTPAADGTFPITLSGGTGTCNFPVTVVAGATVDWKFTVTGASTYQGSFDEGALEVTAVPPFGNITTYDFAGTTPGGDEFYFGLADFAGGIQVNETYVSTSTTSNLVIFEYFGATEEYYADPTITTATLTFKITAHNTAAKTISGTFSGTVVDENDLVKTVTNGTFSGSYP